MDVTTTVTTWGALKLALQIAVHILETEEELYHTLKTAREASEHIFSTRAVIHGSQGLTKRYDTAVASSTLDAGCLEMNIDFFLKRYREIYTQLSSGSPTSGFSDWIHRSRKSEILYLSRKKDRAAGTCEWILKNEKFIQWQRAKDRPLLWISGSPGAGKSTLCSAIVDSLETNRRAGEIIACHYVDGRFKNSKLAFEVLGALAIKALSNGISGESSDQLTTLLNDLDATGEQLSSSQISEFLLRIRHSLSAEETLCLVLDGLDDVEGSQSTIDLVREILYLGIRCNRNGWQPVKILVSSRLNWLSTKDLQSALHVDIDRETSVRNDMAGYVRQSIRESRLSTASLEDNPAEEHSWKRWEALLAAARLVFDLTACDYNRVGSLQATAGNQVDALSRRITYHITEHTEGTFLWARLLVENFLIKANHSYNLFEELLDSSKTKDCSAIYEYMIGHISEEDRLVALQMIRWVVGSARPLYSYELLDAVSSQLSIKLVERDIQKYCGILLSKSKSGTVSLTHLSLRDYLQSRTIEDDILGWAAVSDSTNEMIAQICLQVLSSELLLQSWSSSTLQDSASGPTRHASQTIQSYAYHYWEFHYRHAEGESRHLPGLLHEKLKQGQKCRDAICVTTSIPAPAISGELLNAALKQGARSGMVKLVKLELEMGASPNSTDNLGNTPLHYAAALGNLKLMRTLIEYGGDVKVVSLSGDTALSQAVAKGNTAMVKLLLASGANPFDVSSGSHRDQIVDNTVQSSAHRLSLVVSLSNGWSACGDLQTHYVLFKMCGRKEDVDLWPPIHVTGETVSFSEIACSCTQECEIYTHGTIVSEQRTMVKWFPGVHMYKALDRAAKSGMEGVIRLLVAAGNDTKFLERNLSLSKIMAKMKIS